MQKNSCLAVLVFALLFLLFGASQSFAAWDGKSSEKPVLDTLDKKEFFLIENGRENIFSLEHTGTGDSLIPLC